MEVIDWRALEVPLASQIKGLAVLQEEGGEVASALARRRLISCWEGSGWSRVALKPPPLVFYSPPNGEK